MATYYVDGLNGNDANPGTSFAQAVQTIAAGEALMSAGDELRICSTATYTLTSSVTFNVAGTATAGPTVVTGASATGTVDGTRPTVTSATNSVDLFTVAASHIRVQNVRFTHTASTRGRGVYVSGGGAGQVASNCLFDGCSNGFSGAGVSFGIFYLDRCEAKNCTGDGFAFGTHNYCHVVGCAATANGGAGFNTGIGLGDRHFYSCLAGGNSGAGFVWGGSGHTRSVRFVGCTAAGNTGDGFNGDSDTPAVSTYWFFNNLAYGNGGYGWNWATNGTLDTAVEAAFSAPFVFHNAYGGNTSGARGGLAIAGVGDVTLTADPFTNAAGRDYSLNATAGGGAAARAAGCPGPFPGGTTTGYRDIGAVQHQDAGGGGSTVYVTIPGRRRVVVRESHRRTAVRVVLPGSVVFTTAYIPVRLPARQSVRPAPPSRRVVAVLPGVNTTTTAYVPLRAPPRRVVQVVTHTRQRAAVIPGPATTVTAYVPLPGRVRQLVRPQAPRLLGARVIPGQNTTTTVFVPVRQPSRQYARPAVVRLRPRPVPLAPTVVTLTQTVLVTQKRTVR